MHEKQQVGSTPGVCYGLCQPGFTSTERFLAAENLILRAKLQPRMRLGNPERATWAGDLLCVVLPPFRKPASANRRDQSTPGSGVDGADWPQRDSRDLGLSPSLSVRAARSRHEVLRVVSVRSGKRRVRSAKQECLSKVILLGEGPLSRVLTEYSRHYHTEGNHQGKKTNCFSQMATRNEICKGVGLIVAIDSADSSNTTDEPHEYFYQTGIGETRSCGFCRC